MNTGLLGESSFPSSLQQPYATPRWKAPGLGQTIMTGNLPNQIVLSPSPTVQLSFAGTLLPQQRTEGQPPLADSPPPAANPIARGSVLNQIPETVGISSESLHLHQRQPGQISIIPGSSVQLAQSTSKTFQDCPTPLTFQPTANSNRHSRSLKKPKRSANVALIGLAVLLLGAAVAAAGWLFREPILQLAERFMPKSAPTATNLFPEDPTPVAPVAPVIDIVPSDPKMAESAAVAPTESFDPTETAPAPLKATPAATEEISKATIRNSKTVSPEMTEALALPVSTSDNSLTEAPTAPSGSPIKQATLDSSSMTASEQGKIILDVPPEAKPAADALQKFLAASSLEERLKYTLAVDSMKPLMEEYYSKEPSRPIPVDAIGLVRLDPKPQLGGGAHAVFGVESKSWKFAIPVMLEERDGSFKVDWLSFVEFKDRRLENYLTNFQEGPALFHVSMTRTHYFEDKVPSSSNKEAFRINPAPPNPFSATVFVDKDSALSRDLRDKIPWGAQVFAIVGLEWIKLGNQAWIQMSSVPQLNWYSVPSGPKAVKASSAILRNDSTEVPTEIQKAVPIGR
jgi:hypothetical protein